MHDIVINKFFKSRNYHSVFPNTAVLNLGGKNLTGKIWNKNHREIHGINFCNFVNLSFESITNNVIFL